MSLRALTRRLLETTNHQRGETTTKRLIQSATVLGLILFKLLGVLMAALVVALFIASTQTPINSPSPELAAVPLPFLQAFEALLGVQLTPLGRGKEGAN